jgi:predicted patatin/cPLA2 family phospholipase
LEHENKAIIIRPKNPVEISRFEKNPENLKQLYNIGYEDAKEKYEAIVKLCKDCENVRIAKVASQSC